MNYDERIMPTPSGDTYDHKRDGDRLATLHARVFDAMSDGAWWALTTLSFTTGGTEASVSARLRDFRKPKFGGHTVERKYVGKGLWLYRLIVAS